MHKLINVDDILTKVTNDSDCDVVIASGAWGDNFLPHFFNNIQQNHKLCLDRMRQRYEYVFYTNAKDYGKYKERFTIPDITFLINHGYNMTAAQMNYAFKRQKPLITLASDVLHTTNLIPNLLTKYAHHDACCVMVQRVCNEMLATIKAREQQIPYENIFEPREFLKLCLPHLYPTEIRYFMDNRKATGAYNGMYYPVRKNGILVGELIRAFHLGVIYVKNPIPGFGIDCAWGLDSNPFLGRLATPETIGMIADSDNGYCVDVSTAVDIDANYKDTCSVLTDLSQYESFWRGLRGSNGIAPVNESLMGYNVAIHSEPLTQEWIDLAKKADNFVTHIYGGVIKNKPLMWEMLP